MGNLDHHGKQELFRSDIIKIISLSDIIKFIEVVKLPEYCDKKFKENVYIYR
jgi:hypothetical protein